MEFPMSKYLKETLQTKNDWRQEQKITFIYVVYKK